MPTSYKVTTTKGPEMYLPYRAATEEIRAEQSRAAINGIIHEEEAYMHASGIYRNKILDTEKAQLHSIDYTTLLA